MNNLAWTDEMVRGLNTASEVEQTHSGGRRAEDLTRAVSYELCRRATPKKNTERSRVYTDTQMRPQQASEALLLVGTMSEIDAAQAGEPKSIRVQ